MRPFFLCCILVLFQTINAIAPPDSISKPVSAIKPVIVATGLVAFSFFVDNSLKGPESLDSGWSKLTDIADIAGEKKIVVPTLLATWGLGKYVLKNPKLIEVSEASVKSVLVTAIGTESLKHLTGRARPFMNEGPHSFHPFPKNRDEYKSLPSGHASLAFAVFTPFAEGYSRWIYAVPVSVAAGRVIQNKHWVSDVTVGSAIGFISGYLFYHHRKRVEPIPNGLVFYF